MLNPSYQGLEARGTGSFQFRDHDLRSGNSCAVGIMAIPPAASPVRKDSSGGSV